MELMLTNRGEELTGNGFLTGVFPKITKVKFGDGNGSMVIPDKAMTALVNPIQDGIGTTVSRLGNPNRLYIYTQIPTTVGGITLREVGLYSEDNELIAIGGGFEKVKPPVSESVERFEIYMTLLLTTTQEITVGFSNDNLYAPQGALDVIANAEEANRLELVVVNNILPNKVDSTTLDAVIDDLENQINSHTPVGIIIAIPKTTAPAGYLKCNGAAISRTAYSSLFNSIGTIFGVGDGSTTFNIPDLRGEFIRGWDDGRGVDIGRPFGSTQLDGFKSHAHNYQWTVNGIQIGLGSTWVSLPYQQFATSYVGETETRPRNIALLYCIKY